MQAPAWLSQYTALRDGAGLVDFGDRTRIEITGEDRAKFLHNLCTNDVRRLPIGSGCEAFLTTVQGKVLAHLLVFADSDHLLLETVPGEAERIVAHLEKYHIREDVVIRDVSRELGELFLSGKQADRLLMGLLSGSPPTDDLSTVEKKFAGDDLTIRRIDLLSAPGYLIQYSGDMPKLRLSLAESGATECGSQAFDAARIEAGWPMFGRDITPDNLPQEVARDDRAISFTKGCYLGQETVARIDALGHVNKTLAGVRFDVDAVPAAGLELRADGQTVGKVTSAAFSPRLGRPLALAYVRRGSESVGTQVHSDLGPAQVVALPVA